MSMADRDGLIWYDGKLVPWREATTHVLTHSLHYGLAVIRGRARLQDRQRHRHLPAQGAHRALFNSAHIFMMKMPYDRETLIEAQKEVVRANKLESCYVRPIAFYGSEKMGVSPKGAKVHVAIAAWPWGAYLGAEGLEKGIRVKTSSFARHHINVTMCRAKFSGTYANSILANQEAVEHGYDEALLLDVDGYVAEGAGENLFIVKNGKLYEPELTSALIGITRDAVIQLARDIGLEVRRQAHHARRRLHRRRGLLHRHRGRGDADPRARQPRHRRRAGAARSRRSCSRCSSTWSTAAPTSTPLAALRLSMSHGTQPPGTVNSATRSTIEVGAGPAAALPHCLADAAVERASARVPADREDRRGAVPLLRHALHAQGRRAGRRHH